MNSIIAIHFQRLFLSVPSDTRCRRAPGGAAFNFSGLTTGSHSCYTTRSNPRTAHRPRSGDTTDEDNQIFRSLLFIDDCRNAADCGWCIVRAMERVSSAGGYNQRSRNSARRLRSQAALARVAQSGICTGEFRVLSSICVRRRKSSDVAVTSNLLCARDRSSPSRASGAVFRRNSRRGGRPQTDTAA